MSDKDRSSWARILVFPGWIEKPDEAEEELAKYPCDKYGHLITMGSPTCAICGERIDGSD